jgi:hypothetical protein
MLPALPTYEKEKSKKAGFVLRTNFDNFLPARWFFFSRLFLLHVRPICCDRLFRGFMLWSFVLRRFVLGRLVLFTLWKRLRHVLIQEVEQLVDVLVGDDGVILVRIWKINFVFVTLAKE